MRYNLTLRNNLSAVDHQKGPNYPRTGPAPWKMSRFIFSHHARYDRPKDQAYCSKGGLRMRKPSREALTKRIWFDYFNEVLRKQNLIDWNTYQKIKLSIQQYEAVDCISSSQNHQLSWLSACPDTRSLCPIFPRFSIPHHSFFPFTNEKAQLSLDFFDRLGHPKGCPFFISAGHVQPTLLLPCSYLGYSTGTSICRMHGSGRFTPHPQACQPCIPSHEEDRQNMSSTR